LLFRHLSQLGNINTKSLGQLRGKIGVRLHYRPELFAGQHPRRKSLGKLQGETRSLFNTCPLDDQRLAHQVVNFQDLTRGCPLVFHSHRELGKRRGVFGVAGPGALADIEKFFLNLGEFGAVIGDEFQAGINILVFVSNLPDLVCVVDRSTSGKHPDRKSGNALERFAKCFG